MVPPASGSSWSLSLNIDNLTDEIYYENPGTPQQGNQYGEPRSLARSRFVRGGNHRAGDNPVESRMSGLPGVIRLPPSLVEAQAQKHATPDRSSAPSPHRHRGLGGMRCSFG